jgi:hypothetical protein
MSEKFSDRPGGRDRPVDPDDPRHVPGLEPGGEALPGDTPPGEDSTGGAGPSERHNPAKGWTKTPVVLLSLLVASFLVFCVAYAVLVLL